MLHVVSSEKAMECILSTGANRSVQDETVAYGHSLGRILAEDILAPEDVPAFTRSSVDGYAVVAADTFGCSEAIPAMLTLRGEVQMGLMPPGGIMRGECMYVPTGGQLPPGSNAMVMIERAEDYGGGGIGIRKPAAPGQHCVFQGDDAKAGQVVLQKGTLLRAHDIGTLAALGITQVQVRERLRVGILSTGDEVVPPGEAPCGAQIRDVNGPMLATAAGQVGCQPVPYGICRDDVGLLCERVARMAAECDVLLLSGGTSVGAKDAAPKVMGLLGRIHFHGIAVKPGKPTLFGEVNGAPAFGLPGHPVAAYYVFHEFVAPLLLRMQGRQLAARPWLSAKLAANIPSNHGRGEYVAVRVEQQGGGYSATPLPGKSGLISILSQGNGYIRIPRDQEGMKQGETVQVIPFE